MSSAINKFDKKISEKGGVGAGKGFTLFIRIKIWMKLLKL